jgi:hypothetical protein
VSFGHYLQVNIFFAHVTQSKIAFPKFCLPENFVGLEKKKRLNEGLK